MGYTPYPMLLRRFCDKKRGFAVSADHMRVKLIRGENV